MTLTNFVKIRILNQSDQAKGQLKTTSIIETPTSETDNELKALQGILRSVQEKQSSPSQKVHVWNENGRVHASNTTYPVNNGTIRTIDEVTSSSTETKYTKQGGSILLPVVIGYNGKAIQVNMILDTGCSITLLDEEITNALNIPQTGTVQTVIADGSRMASKTAKVDFIQVGPFKESELLINTRPIKGSGKAQHGLIGMNFLEKHPFSIDHKRNVIVWQ